MKESGSEIFYQLFVFVSHQKLDNSEYDWDIQTIWGMWVGMWAKSDRSYCQLVPNLIPKVVFRVYWKLCKQQHFPVATDWAKYLR